MGVDGIVVSAGLLIVRLILGLLMAAHGAQKLFGWFGGFGVQGMAGFLESFGLRPGRPLAVLAGVAELAGGLLLTLGLFGPVGPALMLSVMVVAAGYHWPNGVFVMQNGLEVPLIYAAVAVGLALTGPGRFALDRVLGLQDTWTPQLDLVVLGICVAGGIVNLLARGDPART